MTGWARVRLVGGLLVLAAIVWRLGAGPFLAGLRSLTPAAALAALSIGVVTTVCSAWRWRVVAGRFGVDLGWRPAIAAYYGSQFLNATLPGGVLGDVHRGVRHGRSIDDVGLGVRAVAWERAAGPVTHLALTALVLAALPSPGLSWLVGPLGLVVLALAVAAVLPVARRGSGRLRSAWPPVLVASVVVAIGHAVTFVIAARLTGVPASAADLAPVAMVVLAAMLVPLNIGGWGPRESVAAAVFAAAGWGAATGVAAATAFGLLALIATLPGLVVLVVRPVGEWVRHG